MKKLFKSNLLVVLGVATGAIAGYCYWKYAGCSSGSCLITSKPVNSTIYGAIMGALLFSMFSRKNTG